MYDYSCMFHYGDAQVGSSGILYFQTTDQFDAWFRNNGQIRWAVLAVTATGEIVDSRNRQEIAPAQPQ